MTHPLAARHAMLVQRALQTRDPRLLAVPLDDYAQAQGMTWAQLAAQLPCSVEQLHRVACCSRPRPEQWQEDVKIIAHHCGCGVQALSTLLEQVVPRSSETGVVEE